MQSFRTKRRVQHTAGDMFDLVADVERYPEFVPLCEKLVVRKREAGEGKEYLIADMTVSYKVFRETFTSRVTLDKPRLEILVEYLNGPFRSLENLWSFRPSGERACEVEFYIAYEFSSRVLGALMGGVFDAAFRRFAEAFERRADKVYGRTVGV
ncbi:MAG: type II toxin-antitoxin system RatA family toxin [Bradyrhizobiaceae bacterium]|nr:type II toxin-antitoxin system RatA family toxin [Bradyrhizobiaceae bacterium]